MHSEASPVIRFSASSTCPVCGGHDALPRGRGVRCHGFISDDRWVFCTREEYAGSNRENSAGGYSHRLTGECRCGRVHGVWTPKRTSKTQTKPDRNGSGAFAQEIWKKAQPASRSLVEAYLRARGIDAPTPPSLRFTPSLKHSTGRWFPAMVAGVTVWPSKAVSAIHRTWLRSDGSGKADVEGTKKMLGPVKGGAVRLAPLGETLVVGEGIETCLSVAEATGLPTWACLSASNLLSMVLPELPLASRVVIAADGDGAGLYAAHSARDLWMREGRKVFVACPGEGRDFNDELLEVAK